MHMRVSVLRRLFREIRRLSMRDELAAILVWSSRAPRVLVVLVVRVPASVHSLWSLLLLVSRGHTVCVSTRCSNLRVAHCGLRLAVRHMLRNDCPLVLGTRTFAELPYFPVPSRIRGSHWFERMVGSGVGGVGGGGLRETCV